MRGCRYDPYQHTQFNEKYYVYAASQKAMRWISRKTGKFMEVDWADSTLAIDSITGSLSPRMSLLPISSTVCT